MSVTDYLIPPFLSSWFGKRRPLELTGSGARPQPPQATGEPRTTGQQGSFGASSTWVDLSRCCVPVPAGDYPVWRAMDGDATLALARFMVTAPIFEADKNYEAREGTPDEWVKLIQGSVDPLWDEYVRESSDVLSMGWKPFEPVFARREGRTVLGDLKPLAQEITTVLSRRGAFAGLRNAGEGDPVDLDAAASLVVSIDGKNRDPYGRSWHENCRQPWWDKVQCLKRLALLGNKASGIQGKAFYPPAADESTNHTNEKKAVALLQDYMAGKGAVMPNATGSLTPELAADFRNIQGMAEAALWKLEIEDHGDTGTQAGAFLDELRYHNAELCRGWHVPERAATEAVTAGSRADSETADDAATRVSQDVYNQLCRAISRGPVDTILVENYGEQARGSVWVAAGRLSDVYAVGDWKMVDALLRNADIALQVFGQVDFDAIFARRGIPVDGAILKLREAIEGVLEQREKDRQQQAQAVKAPPVNGKPRLAMARGVEWLGRVLGGENGHDDE